MELTTAKEEKPKSSKLNKSGAFKMSEGELRNQVDNYYTLPITKTYRGVSTLLILAALTITAFLYLVHVVDLPSLVGGVLIYLPLAYFIYKGKRWAIIGAMAMWTIDKGYQLTTFPNPLIILWWLAFLSYFYKAYKVEIAKSTKTIPQQVIE